MNDEFNFKEALKCLPVATIGASFLTFVIVSALINTMIFWGWFYTGDPMELLSKSERDRPAAVAPVDPSTESNEQAK